MGQPIDPRDESSKESKSGQLTRREAIKLGGMSALGATFLPTLFLTACKDLNIPVMRSGQGGGTASFPALPSSCVLTPEETEGPFYVDVNLLRSNVIESQQGFPLNLEIVVVDATTCAPISGKAVEIWHANASGVYSDIASEGTTGQTFLRGALTTDSSGTVSFQTVYPGWYQGRTTHIHFKVHLGANQVVTSQLYFDDALNDQIYQKAPYNQHTGSRTPNADDSVRAQDPDPGNDLFLKTNVASDAVYAAIRVGVTQ